MSFVEYKDGSKLREKVNQWISENEENILEIIDIEYDSDGNIYYAIITFEERKK